jgi:dUTP pyrophosphatase
MRVKIYRLNKKNPVPRYMSSGASGVDLYASLQHTVEIPQGGTVCIPVGIIVCIPEGYEAQVRPRSGLAVRYGVTVLNSPGTVDSDYRGEVKVVLVNHGSENFVVRNGMRIAQMVFAKVEKADIIETSHLESFDQTERNGGGFGHTGV